MSFLLEVKLPYEMILHIGGLLVGRLVDWSVVPIGSEYLVQIL